MSDKKMVCPWCPLHCDDVFVKPIGKAGMANDNISFEVECKLARRRFTEIAGLHTSARVGEKSVSNEDLLETLRHELQAVQRIEILTDHATLGESQLLAAESSFEVLANSSPTGAAFSSAVARCGSVWATLADIKNHADLIVELGDFSSETPRLREKLSRDDCSVNWIQIKPTPDLIAELVHHSNQAGKSESEAGRLADKIDAAKYVAFLVSQNAFATTSAAPIAEMLVEYIIKLNDAQRTPSQRAVMMMLDPLATLKSVYSWQHNTPLAHTGARSNNPSNHVFRVRLAATRVAAELDNDRQVDLQIGGSDPGSQQTKMFAPATIAGVHFDDIVIRGDGTVTLPLQKSMEAIAHQKSTADWLLHLAERVRVAQLSD